MKRLQKYIVIFGTAMLCAGFSVCSKQPDFDAKSYVQSSLEAVYHGTYADYALLMEILEEEIATYTEKPHVHFKDGTALNQDGTVHDAHKGNPNLTNGTRKWVERKLKNEILWI